MSAQAAIRRYDNFINGKAPFFLQSSAGRDDDNISAEQRKRLADAEKEKDALSIVRHVVKDVLGWTPEQAMEHIDAEVARRARLDMLFKYIDCPMEVVRGEDYQWMVHKAFPSETRYDGTEQLFRIYDLVLSGRMKKFPRNFFTGERGMEKVVTLFRSYVSRNVPASSIADLYRIFSDNARGWNILRDAHLYYEVAPAYSSPLEFLHDSIGAEADDFLYSFYQFNAAVKELERARRRAAAGQN